jgi:Methyltransferase domain
MLIAPARDELLLLHYKFLGFERTHLRHQQQRSGLRSKDIENGWGYQYGWSEGEFGHAWREFAGNAIDVRMDAAIANYPIPRWWDSFRSLATQPLAHTPNIDPRIEQGPTQEVCLVPGQTIMSDVGTAISPVSFWVPDYICQSAWIEHAPFAFWLCEALRPRRFVELGTHYGYSYFAFCQAIDRLGLATTAYAVDTWKGDEHAGFYDESVFQSVATRNNEKYSAFSSLIRSTFNDALGYFADASVDLLHIDGRHLYDDVAHDFTTWRPKLSEDAVVLFHDTNVREREFGVGKFFERVAAQHPSFQFFHGYGLGLIILGDRVPAPLAPLFEAPREIAHQIRAAYAALGSALTVRAALGQRHHEIDAMNTEHARSLGEIEGLKALIATIVNERDEAVAGLAAGREALASSRALLAETEQFTGVLQATLAERDGALAAISQRANEFFAAIQSAEANMAKRDDDLLRAERELSGRNAAAVALQSEVITLRNALAAARDVGRAALAALRAEPAMMSGSRRNAGRLALVGRSFGFRGRDQ